MPAFLFLGVVLPKGMRTKGMPARCGDGIGGEPDAHHDRGVNATPALMTV